MLHLNARRAHHYREVTLLGLRSSYLISHILESSSTEQVQQRIRIHVNDFS